MRDLKESEIEKVTDKLRLFVGDNLKDLLDDKVLKLNNQRVFLLSNQILKACSQVGRKQLISAGTIIGKFTKTDNFKITITAFHALHKHAVFKVWIKYSAEMNFLYGNNSLRSHIHKISEGIPMNAGVFVYNQNDTPLGFGLFALNSTSYSRARGGDIVVLRQADNGEYIRSEANLA